MATSVQPGFTRHEFRYCHREIANMPTRRKPSEMAAPLPTPLQELIARTEVERRNQEAQTQAEREKQQRHGNVARAIQNIEGLRGNLREELKREPTDEECAERLQKHIIDFRNSLATGGFTAFWASITAPDSESVTAILRDLPPSEIALSLLHLHADPIGCQVFARLWDSISLNLSRWWSDFVSPPASLPTFGDFLDYCTKKRERYCELIKAAQESTDPGAASKLRDRAEREGTPWTDDIPGAIEVVEELEKRTGRPVDLQLLHSLHEQLLNERGGTVTDPTRMPLVELARVVRGVSAEALKSLHKLRAPGTLPPTAKAVLGLLKEQKGRGLTGKEIVSKLRASGTTVSQSTLRRHILPVLRLHGVQNERGRGGYFIDPSQSRV